MKVTSFNARKTTNKFPVSPYGNDTFQFEVKEAGLSDIFSTLAERFTLNITLTKDVLSIRSARDLKPFMVTEIDYIIIDLDDVKSETDRQLCLKYFRDRSLRVMLGAGRRPYNIKGVMQVEPMTIKEGKQVLTEMQEVLGDKCSVDISVLNRGSFQAPINKHQVLLDQTNEMYKIQKKSETQPIKIATGFIPSTKLEGICHNLFHEKGFQFVKPTQEGYICAHTSEVKTPNGYTWSREYPFSMVHWNPSRNVSVWEEAKNSKEYKELQRSESKNLVQSILPSLKGNTNVRYLSHNPDIVTDFLDNYQMLRIQSPMGTAKSTVIEEVLHQCNKRKLSVLFLTNRISLADDICLKYPDIKHYQGPRDLDDEPYDPDEGHHLALQIDSFSKFSTKFFDVVILDEFTTTAVKLLSIENNQSTVVTKFLSLKKKKLVVADAFLFPEMTDLFTKNSIDIINEYRDDTDLCLFDKKNNFITDIISEAKKGPVSFSSGSSMLLKVVQELADKNNLSWYSIDSSTPKNERDLAYESLRNKKAKWDILMYSPTLTVGVSNENQTLIHYHYDTSNSMDVLSSIQMIKRTRKAKIIKMYLKEKVKYNPTDLMAIQAGIPDYSEQDEDGDNIGITAIGNNFSKIIRIYNILENRHKEAFLGLLGYQFNKTPVKVSGVSNISYAKLSKAVKRKEKNHLLDVFEEYQSMSAEAISDIDSLTFGTNIKERAIKEFELYRQDTINDYINETQLKEIIKENINLPGTIEHLKNQIKNPILGRNGQITKNEKNKYTTKGTDIKEYGYRRRKHLWVLNKCIHKILKDIND